MSKLLDLKRRFKPRRTYSCSHTTVEVDAIMVRVAHDEEQGEEGEREEVWQGWKPLCRVTGEAIAYEIPVDDILQDPQIIRGARVSTGRDTKAVDEKGDGMINFLWRDKHLTPLQQIQIRLRHVTPMPYGQPFFRLFATHNEQSGRYSVIEDRYHMPPVNREAMQIMEASEHEARYLYKMALEAGISKEQARLLLLYRFTSKFYMTISLRHIMEFLSLQQVPGRHETTQFYDIQLIYRQIVQDWMPWAFAAWEKYPSFVNFDWIPGVLRQVRPLASYPPWKTVQVLDKGEVKFHSPFGLEDYMLAALDDFPDPRGAFGHGSMLFTLKAPIHVLRQWLRHRNGHWTEPRLQFDQIVRNNDFYVPQQFYKQIGKIGHYQFEDLSEELNTHMRVLYQEYIQHMCDHYQELRSFGVSEEVAGMNLPFCFYVSAGWTTPIDGLMNFLSLRADSHAQWEIRQYAAAIWPWFLESFPRSAKLFAQHLHYGDAPYIKALAQG